MAQIEQGNLKGPQTRAILEDALLPMLERGIDTVVLGCTHYPFVIPLIREIVGENVRVIDPAPAVARQAQRLLETLGLKQPAGPTGRVQFFTSGSVEPFEQLLPLLFGELAPVQGLRWQTDLVLSFPQIS